MLTTTQIQGEGSHQYRIQPNSHFNRSFPPLRVYEAAIFSHFPHHDCPASLQGEAILIGLSHPRSQGSAGGNIFSYLIHSSWLCRFSACLVHSCRAHSHFLILLSQFYLDYFLEGPHRPDFHGVTLVLVSVSLNFNVCWTSLTLPHPKLQSSSF